MLFTWCSILFKDGKSLSDSAKPPAAPVPAKPTAPLPNNASVKKVSSYKALDASIDLDADPGAHETSLLDLTHCILHHAVGSHS